MTIRPQRLRGPAMRGVTRVVCIPPVDAYTPMRLYLLSPLLGQLALRVGPLDAHEIAVAVAFTRPVDLTVDLAGSVWVADALGLHKWDADLDAETSFNLEGITAIAAMGASGRIAVAYADGSIEARDSAGVIVAHYVSPWVLTRLLWSTDAGLVGLTDDGRVVRFDIGLTVVYTAAWETERRVTSIRNLRTAVVVGTILVMVGADRSGNGAVTTYDLDADVATSNRVLAQSVILSAVTASTGTEKQPDGVSWMPWHIPVTNLLDESIGDSPMDAATGTDEVWISLDVDNVLNSTRHILNEIPQHITNEAGERIVWEGP